MGVRCRAAVRIVRTRKNCPCSLPARIAVKLGAHARRFAYLCPEKMSHAYLYHAPELIAFLLLFKIFNRYVTRSINSISQRLIMVARTRRPSITAASRNPAQFRADCAIPMDFCVSAGGDFRSFAKIVFVLPVCQATRMPFEIVWSGLKSTYMTVS